MFMALLKIITLNGDFLPIDRIVYPKKFELIDKSLIDLKQKQAYKCKLKSLNSCTELCLKPQALKKTRLK